MLNRILTHRTISAGIRASNASRSSFTTCATLAARSSNSLKPASSSTTSAGSRLNSRASSRPNPRRVLEPSPPKPSSASATRADGLSPTWPTFVPIYDEGRMTISLLAFTLRDLPLIIYVLGAYLTLNERLGATTDSIPVPATIAALTVAAVPIFLLYVITAGRVVKVAIEAPAHARRSNEALLKWSRTLPEDAWVKYTMLSVIGLPASSYCRLSELRPLQSKTVSWRALMPSMHGLNRFVEPRTDNRKIGSLWSRLRARLAEPPRKLIVQSDEAVAKQKTKIAHGVWSAVLQHISRKQG